MTLLASLPQDKVIRGLEILESLLTLGNLQGEKGRNIGAWAWGLLGRCREVGEMGSEEVGVVRGVGKMAGWVLRRMVAGEGFGGEEEGEEVEDGDGEEARLEDAKEDGVADGVGSHILDDEDEDSALAEARKRVIASLDSAEPLEPILASKDLQDQPADEHEASIEPEVDAVASGPAKVEENDLHSVHATLDMIITIIGECYGQKDLLDSRLLWEEIEWMSN